MKEGMKEGRKEKSQAIPSEGYKSMMYSIVNLDLVFRLFVSCLNGRIGSISRWQPIYQVSMRL